MKVFYNAIFVFWLTAVFPCLAGAQVNLNMTLQDSLTYSVGVNDVCGWVAQDGREYALVGLNTGVSIVDVDSDTIKEVVFVSGVNNLWRDINTFGHYAYVTSEARVGLLIIDLQYLPDSVQTYIWQDSLPTTVGNRPFEKAHTLFIDEYGIAYLNGSNLNSGGVILIDVASSPTDPIFLGYAPNIYSHDVYARDSILYSAEIYLGNLSIYDVHDPANITLLGQVKTPHEFTHNAWLSDDSRYMFTADERANSYVAAYDIQDPSNIIEVDRFRQAAVDGSGAIVHNVYVWNDWLVLAYYSSGTLIVDAARPHNLIEVGSFDSFLGADGNFNGVWGSYPFLPSGKILTSDRNSGLYVFIPNYVRAAYLEGTVVDSITHQPIQGALVSIISDEIVLPVSTSLDGTFKTGKAVPGVFDITVKKEGYYPKTIQANFMNGELLTPVFELNPLPVYSFSGKVVYIGGQQGVPFAKVNLSGPEGIFETETDEDGNFIMPTVYGGEYEVQAGIWGYTMQTDILLDQPTSITLQVVTGYYDDFDIDLGWIVTGQVTEGQWTRGLPAGQKLFDNWQCSSPTDSPFDIGSNLYSTGLNATQGAENDEVSGGATILTSPPMDLDSIFLPYVSFDYWLCEYPPNQYLGFTAWWTNGIDTILIEEFRNDTTTGSWQRFSTGFEIDGPRDHVQILFAASDTTPGTGDYFLKVHVDNFRLVEGANSINDDWAIAKHFLIYPNPVDGSTIYLKAQNGIEGHELSLNIFDLHGRLITAHQISKKEAESGFHHKLKDGIYFMQWRTDKGESGLEKILVIRK